MTYHYAMTGTACAAVYREIGGELVLQFYVDGNKHSGEFCDIAAIARATVAALNGTTAEPRVVWHPMIYTVLSSVDHFLLTECAGNYGAERLRHRVLNALALVDQPPSDEKVVGWAILDRDGTIYCHCYHSLSAAREAQQIDSQRRIVRLVEEPTP